MKDVSSATPREISANLDMLRAIAVMLVFISHLFQAAIHDFSFSSVGTFGVVLFFVHTSFVLMASLQRLEKSAESDTSLVLAFWTRRIFRIYPLAILCVVLAAVFHIPARPWWTYSWIGLGGFLSNLALIQNVTNCPDIQGPMWSLPVEVQMYVILPLAYLAIRNKRRYCSLIIWVLSILFAFSLVLLLWRWPTSLKRLNVFFYAPCFTSGIVAFDLIRNRGWTWRLPAWAWPVGIFAAIILFGPHDSAGFPDKLFRAWWLSLFVGALYSNVKESRPNSIHRIFHWIAEHSYGIYLSHCAVLWIIFYTMAKFPLWVKIPALIAGSTGIPALLYLSIEKPLILTGSHLARRLLRHGATG